MTQPGLIIIESLAGSRLYGTFRPDSDTDVRGVGLTSKGSLIGLEPAFEIIEQEVPVDRVIHELRKFAHLALKNNPNILDTLFAPPEMWLRGVDELADPYHLWEHIYLARRSVLSQEVRKTYVGYGMSQLKRIKTHRKWTTQTPIEPDQSMYGRYNSRNQWVYDSQPAEEEYRNKKREWDNYAEWRAGRNPARHELESAYGYDTKHAAHLVRLMIQAQAILMHGDFSPVLAGKELDIVLRVLHGEWEYDTVLLWAEEAMQMVDTLTTDLPPRANMDRMNEAVQRVYSIVLGMS